MAPCQKELALFTNSLFILFIYLFCVFCSKESLSTKATCQDCISHGTSLFMVNQHSAQKAREEWRVASYKQKYRLSRKTCQENHLGTTHGNCPSLVVRDHSLRTSLFCLGPQKIPPPKKKDKIKDGKRTSHVPSACSFQASSSEQPDSKGKRRGPTHTKTWVTGLRASCSMHRLHFNI